jgi:glycosyltransferase involved in cell wall biosynthesis
MNIGIVIPGFSSDEDDWAIPVQQHLARVMAARDEVRVIALRYPHRRDRYHVYGAEVHSLGVGAWTRGWRRLALWRSAIALIRRLNREKPFDVLHAMWADENGLIAAWAGRTLRVPVVVSVAGGEVARLSAIRYGLQNSAFSRWTVGQALRGADTVIAACAYARDQIAACGYDLPDERIRIVPLGVDTRLFSPGDGPPEARHLIHAASLVGVKDQGTLLRALAQIPGATLDVIGDGPERPRLSALAASLGIADRVRFLGAIPHLQTPAHYRRAALHVITSRHEGQGMVTVEAAACGVPTVSTAVGIVPDYPDLGEAVPVGDPVALAATVRALLDNPARRSALAASALGTARQRFAIERTADDLRRVYDEVISRRRS